MRKFCSFPLPLSLVGGFRPFFPIALFVGVKTAMDWSVRYVFDAFPTLSDDDMYANVTEWHQIINDSLPGNRLKPEHSAVAADI